MKIKKGIKSMTGVSTKSGREGNIFCKLEIISLNSLGSEFKVILQPEIPGIEAKVRNFLEKHLKDGKFVVKINFPETGLRFKINENLIKDIKLKSKKNLLFTIDPFKIPGLVKFIYPEKRIWILLKKLLKKALIELEEKRLKEGEEIKKAIEREIKKIVFNLEKMNSEKINEEIVRIGSHIKSIMRILKNKDGPWGKKLDFYGQEILKEANTISQKTEDLKVINSAIKIKESALNIRELARNLV
ncbi:MAG: DUF1732 domain-containing protein [candidate division WOR-3 bacterium]